MSAKPPIRVGILGLGLGALLTIPYVARDRRFRIVAAADPRTEATEAFEAAIGGRAYRTIEELSEDREVELVYVSTPHFLHHRHALAAMAAGKHVLVEKPLARNTQEGAEIVEAAAQRGLRAFYGHTHAYDLPIREMARVVNSGALGRLGAIVTLNYTDMVYRPRAEWELDPMTSGGTVLIQAPHQVDIARAIASSPVSRVSGWSAALDPERTILSMHTALLEFENGAAATLVFSGKGHFDSARWVGWVGESGERRDPLTHQRTWQSYLERGESAEADARNARRIGPRGLPLVPPADRNNEAFGVTIVSCANGDIRNTRAGLVIDEGARRRFVRLATESGRDAMLDDVYRTMRLDDRPVIDANWGLETLRICAKLERAVGT